MIVNALSLDSQKNTQKSQSTMFSYYHGLASELNI